jgi:hypothetical protein
MKELEMEKIQALTAEQIALLPVFRDKWLKIGLDTARLDFQKTIDAVNLAYEKAGISPPRFFMFPDGPTEAMKFISVASKCNLTEQDFIKLSDKSPISLTEAIRAVVSVAEIGRIETVWPGFYGQHEAGWLGFQEFFAENFGLSELSQGLRDLAKNSGWVWMYGDLAIVSQKPIRVTLLNGRLHDEKRAAVEYADGTRVYAFNGVVLPEKWVIERDTMDPSEIFECSDTDVRAAGIALYGYSRVKHKLNYRVVEGDPETDIGALVEISIPGLRAPGRFLEAICPRNGPVWLGVPKVNPWDGNKPIKTAVGAQAFLARLPESAYQHPPIRT